MNIKFKNFNFDEWLEKYIITVMYLDVENPDPLLIESEKEAIKSTREAFYNQNHNTVVDFEDSLCLACEYINMLNSFNKFMAIISRPEINHDELDAFLKLDERFKNSDFSKKEIVATNLGNLLYEFVDVNRDAETNL